jgi:predicted O-methyltransferase YrrM
MRSTNAVDFGKPMLRGGGILVFDRFRFAGGTLLDYRDEAELINSISQNVGEGGPTRLTRPRLLYILSLPFRRSDN